MAKSYEELSFVDDFMFCKILYENPEVCRELLSLILNKKVTTIKYPEKQKAIELTADGKGIRLDVYLEDDTSTVYDIEMQTTKNSNLPKRTRYYQGMIDLNLISRGADYNELKSSYIIFICTSDPFTLGKCKYTFTNHCEEYPEIELKDGSTKVFLNVSGDFTGLSNELINLMNYISKGDVKGEFVKKIDNEVQKAKNHEEWRDEYMTLLMRDKENYNEGLSVGREEGKSLLIEAVIALRNGSTESDLKALGFDNETIRQAVSIKQLILKSKSHYGGSFLLPEIAVL